MKRNVVHIKTAEIHSLIYESYVSEKNVNRTSDLHQLVT